MNNLISQRLSFALVAGLFSAAAQVHPVSAAGQVGYINFITAGFPDPSGKLPAINGVPGAGVSNLDIALPASLLRHGNSYVYVVSTQNNTFNGTCVDSYQLTQVRGGVTVILDSKTIRTFACGPGSQWEWALTGKPIPNSPGPATLIGIVKFGLVTVKVMLPVLIQ